MPLDVESYFQYLSDTNLTYEEKIEVLDQMFCIVERFIDVAWNSAEIAEIS